jgi:uncharacterized membrane protein (DUF2068 family)
MVILTTAGFIPLENYEISRHATVFRVVVLVANVLIVVYIGMRVRWRHLAKVEARSRGEAIISR